MNHPELDFARYPSAPGYKRGGTSKSAADSMREKAPSLCDRVLFYMKTFDTPNGFTADEVADDLEQTVLAIRPRFTSLSRPHPFTGAPAKIYDTGLTRPNASGRMATVWRAV